jgi:hypothetical protein
MVSVFLLLQLSIAILMFCLGMAGLFIQSLRLIYIAVALMVVLNVLQWVRVHLYRKDCRDKELRSFRETEASKSKRPIWFWVWLSGMIVGVIGAVIVVLGFHYQSSLLIYISCGSLLICAILLNVTRYYIQTQNEGIR